MNGLYYIRTRCNVTTQELADYIDVMPQTITTWELDSNQITEKRRKQLSDYFGVDERYFGELLAEDKEELLDKAMFCYEVNGREKFLYRRDFDMPGLERDKIYFLEERMRSLDEENIMACRRSNALLKRIASNLDGTAETVGTLDKSMVINRGCDIYEMANVLYEATQRQERYLKVAYRYELVNVLNAMLVAYGLIEIEDLYKSEKNDDFYGVDVEWIIQLADLAKRHWDNRKAFLKELHEQAYKTVKEEKSKIGGDISTPSVEEQIISAEQRYKEDRKSQGIAQTYRFITYICE